MIYLYGYLGIGFIALFIVLLEHYLSRSRYTSVVESLTDSFDPNYKKWWWAPVHKILLPTLTGIVVISFWPIALYMKLKDLLNTDSERQEKTPSFAVSKEHLIQCLSVKEIEQAEILDHFVARKYNAE